MRMAVRGFEALCEAEVSHVYSEGQLDCTYITCVSRVRDMHPR